ncbi:hypothetical protein ZIOFF_010022 [Zingiber officinale]|uniref:VQ domain-containing protein n=1 Tax=Zingiber officinale TaxID=94328 RepID=A0A8J5HNX3_ZINOF|nr:hypothetical protein ZIOFF_010022 [Zingiber officinale]
MFSQSNRSGGAASAGRRPVPAKIKVIVTTFVEAEAWQFQSVVQWLTGKDAVVTGEVEPPESIGGGRQRHRDVTEAEVQKAGHGMEAEGEVEIMPEAALHEMLEWFRD